MSTRMTIEELGMLPTGRGAEPLRERPLRPVPPVKPITASQYQSAVARMTFHATLAIAKTRRVSSLHPQAAQAHALLAHHMNVLSDQLIVAANWIARNEAELTMRDNEAAHLQAAAQEAVQDTDDEDDDALLATVEPQPQPQPQPEPQPEPQPQPQPQFDLSARWRRIEPLIEQAREDAAAMNNEQGHGTPQEASNERAPSAEEKAHEEKDERKRELEKEPQQEPGIPELKPEDECVERTTCELETTAEEQEDDARRVMHEQEVPRMSGLVPAPVQAAQAAQVVASPSVPAEDGATATTAEALVARTMPSPSAPAEDGATATAAVALALAVAAVSQVDPASCAATAAAASASATLATRVPRPRVSRIVTPKISPARAPTKPRTPNKVALATTTTVTATATAATAATTAAVAEKKNNQAAEKPKAMPKVKAKVNPTMKGKAKTPAAPQPSRWR